MSAFVSKSFPQIRQEGIRKRHPEVEIRKRFGAGDPYTGLAVRNSGESVNLDRYVMCKQARNHIIQILYGRILPTDRKERRGIFYPGVIIGAPSKRGPYTQRKASGAP